MNLGSHRRAGATEGNSHHMNLVVRQANSEQLLLGPPASCRQTLAGRMPAVPGGTTGPTV